MTEKVEMRGAASLVLLDYFGYVLKSELHKADDRVRTLCPPAHAPGQIAARESSERQAKLPSAAADFCFAESSPIRTAVPRAVRTFAEAIMRAHPSSSRARWRKQAQQLARAALAWRARRRAADAMRHVRIEDDEVAQRGIRCARCESIRVSVKRGEVSTALACANSRGW